jgi:hypothetical protein
LGEELLEALLEDWDEAEPMLNCTLVVRRAVLLTVWEECTERKEASKTFYTLREKKRDVQGKGDTKRRHVTV